MIFIKVASSIFHNVFVPTASNERLSTRLLGKDNGEINSSESKPDNDTTQKCSLFQS